MPTVEQPAARNGNGQHTTNELEISSDLPEGIVHNNEGLLSLKEIEARTGGDNYQRLVRFAQSAEHRGSCSARSKLLAQKGFAMSRGPSPVFQRLLDAQNAGALTPATAVAWLKATEAAGERISADNAIIGKTQSDNALVETASAGEQQMGRGFALILAPVVSIMQEVRDLLHDFRSGKVPVAAPAAPLPDRLLTAEQAADLLACKPRSVGLRVQPFSENPRRYRESDVWRYIGGPAPAQKDIQKDIQK